ncbi:OmpH family outer membrane protein [Hydrogenothermus marinus]|uniref:Periplasmic chaperone for outer membrane proteins Skp n=1 Tax=Hydrogenothermus marinus TaxID=133270 RepID=A0A3M0B7Y8_9AQUI|nr:OmpH family outer membrane protein [Hydrogenothermus marinus]RMA93237.1 periplasmic chaperone for outer membrane proteins Skp [Hydrogenothermus marinus]
MKKFLSLFLLLLVITGYSYAQEKLAYVDLIKVMNQSKTGHNLRKEIEDKFNFYKQKIKDMQNQIEEIKKQLESPLLSDKAKSEKQAKIRELERQIRNLTIEAQTKLNKMKQDAEKQLIEKIKLAAKEYTDKNNTDIIFTNGLYGAILYASKKIDITDKIIKLLDKEEK